MTKRLKLLFQELMCLMATGHDLKGYEVKLAERSVELDGTGIVAKETLTTRTLFKCRHCGRWQETL
jgi:hypothetical protein